MNRLTVPRVVGLMTAAVAAGALLGSAAWLVTAGADALPMMVTFGAMLGFVTAPPMVVVLADRSWWRGVPLVYGPALGAVLVVGLAADPMLLVGGSVTVFWLDCWLAMVLLPAGHAGDYHAHCPACGYDLTGNRSGRCPECGRPTIAASSVPIWDDDEWRQITPALFVAAFAVSAICLVYIMFLLAGR